MTIPFKDDEIPKPSDNGVQKYNEQVKYESYCSSSSDHQPIACALYTNIDYDTSMHSYEKSKNSQMNIYILALCIIFFVKCVCQASIYKTMIRKYGYTTKVKVKWKSSLKIKESCFGHKSLLDNIIMPFRNIPKSIIKIMPFLPQDFRTFLKDEKKSQSMQFEGARFSTFSTFPDIPGIYATRLAEAGFFYSGFDDEVICHSCGVKHKHWNRYDVPFNIHKQISPNCSFLLDIKPVRDEATSMSGACGRNEIEPDNTEFISDDKSSHISFKSKDEKWGSRGFSSTCSHQISSANVNNNRTEGTPIASSYSKNDTQSLIRTPEFNTHTQHSQHGILNATGSIMQDVCTKSTSQNNQRESTALGVCLDKPKYPKYAIRSVRLDSFNHWPQYLTQSPEEMVTAGFYFTGTDDHCRCFFCGGGLRSWEPGDHPWIEHARWYQKCAFLRQCKGDKFIEDVQMNRILPNENENNWRPNSSGETRIQVTKPVEYSNHPAVMAVADFGYDERVVKKAYESLQKSGSTEITGTRLLEAIFQLEENGRHNESTNSTETEQQPFNGTQKAKLDNLKEANKNKSTEEATCNPDLELSIRSLEEENQNLKDQQTCKICLDEPIAIVFLPCGHLAACTNCAPALRRCPICRAFIKGTVKAILS
ncbi:baculoviral IAP repeat-containing protein 7-A-like [Mytilus edulis]|uniref:baculoviral IAP repeat-containing protein 7-A-like n=1 Tax=Mytilus edulis TaxID=6550 RepID=UPI0039EF016D